MMYLPLILIPICALLNHWGGQSTVIPNPRIVCRVFGISAAFAVVSYFCIHSPNQWIQTATVCLLGMALYAVPGWSKGFVCIPPYNDTRGAPDFLSKIVNELLGVTTEPLSPYGCHLWGMLYLTLRGLYIYPLFAGLGYMITPWAYLIGIAGAFQGLIYGTSSLVLWAEPKMGTLIGVMLAAVLIIAAAHHFSF